jgi:hypothetical protein
MVSHAGIPGVPRHVVDYLARLLAAHRRQINTPEELTVLGSSARPGRSKK